ncbi:MAG: hypothetical protein DMF86_24210 [Acidobacteria bacterium]|nr:MAG: hypothetical protein DMF86_24210 [Acidobacteriota bacterium]
MTTEHAASPDSLLYIVHAAADRDLAILLRARIRDVVPGLQVFLASKAGEIPTGEDWLAHIHQNLKAATSFLLLLTPRSIERHWVWYEAGVAWSRGCRQLPVTAGGLDRATVHYPLKAAQILAQLFRDLGAELESPEVFCRTVRATALPPPGSPADLQRVRDALAQVFEPPRAVLRRMLAGDHLTFDDMRAVLERSGFAADGHSAQLVLDVLRRTDLLQADDNQRWSLRPDVKDSVRRCLNPSLAQKFQSLAEQMRAWAGTQTGGFDGNGWQQKFVPQLTALRQKARDHGEDDAWLDKVPSHYTAVHQIADALVRVAQRLPDE